MHSVLSPAPRAARPANQAALASLLVQSDLIALALARGRTLLFANAAFGKLFGLAGTIAGTLVTDLVVPRHHDRIAAMLQAADREQSVCVADVASADGSAIQVEFRARTVTADRVVFCAIFAQDVSDRSRATARLNLLAFSDPLTGLANRALFADRLRQAALDARRDEGSFALIMLDLDGFKPVNDRYGHACGDAVLQQVADRLRACLRNGETIARLGGDEFGIVVGGIRSPTDAAGVADRLLVAIREPFAVDKLRLALTATAGVAVFPDHAGRVEQLLVAADTALYAAKRAGGGRCGWPSQHPISDAPPAVTWSVVHELGVLEMDAQHAAMADALNMLATALHNGDDHRPAFRDFIRYAAFHFASEERLMALSHYHRAANHQDIHKQLLAEAAGLADKGDSGSPSLMLRYLQEWLFRHIDHADRELAAYLLENQGELAGAAES